MRKAIFALAMITAAFAGGAAVNGQGLALIQALVRTLANKSDFVKVVDAPPPPAAASDPSLPPREVPAAPIAPLVLDAPKTDPAVAAAPSSPPVAPPTPPAVAKTPEVASTPPPAPAPLPATAVEMPAPMPAPLSEAPPRDAPLATATPSAAPPGEIQPPRPPRAEPDRDESVARADLSAETPRPDPLPVPVPVPSPAAGPASGRPIDWADLRKRLANAGVTRFEVESELPGRTRFRCVIPIAGRRAVAQLFEGEGADEFQAAESALKRVRLWRLAEGTAPDSK